MKKAYILFLGIFIALVSSFNVLALDYSDDWYIYKGTSSNHSFTVRFPQDWQVNTEGNHLQSFGPIFRDSYFRIQEFEGQTYQQVQKYFEDDSTQLVDIREAIIISQGEDLVTKQVTYKDLLQDKLFLMTLVKRGNTIFAISNPNLDGSPNYPAPSSADTVVEAIYNSFQFSDDWSQYIDYKDKYTFIFPSELEIVTYNNRVEVLSPNYNNKPLFYVHKYSNTSLSKVAEMAEGYGEQLESTKIINLHDLGNAISATYVDLEKNRKLSKIFIEHSGNSFAITNINLEDNFPHMNYYDEFILEMIESFEFFDVDSGYSPYEFFPDVRNSHPNSTAINYLKQESIIGGYEDGTFHPDGEITKGELLKILVIMRENPDPEYYSNCFEDVEDQWHAPYICYAKDQKWINGFEDGTFLPDEPVTRAEALKMIYEAEFEKNISENNFLADPMIKDIPEDAWYKKYVVFGLKFDLLDLKHLEKTEDGLNLYLPESNITRKEVAETIFRSIIFKKFFIEMEFSFFNFNQ
ncbi:S-layer homology domain-containing protein [Patescibacteria group bacterium]